MTTRFRKMLIIGMVGLLVIGVLVAIGGGDEDSESNEVAAAVTPRVEPEPKAAEPETVREVVRAPKPVPAAAPKPEPAVAPEPAPDPTFEESYQEFVVCNRLLAESSMQWGQAPGVIYSGNPQVTGQIQAGDYIRFLTAPTSEGVIRVKVFPHDGRAVGKSNDQVWLDWEGLRQFRLDRLMFTCEDNEETVPVAPAAVVEPEPEPAVTPAPEPAPTTTAGVSVADSYTSFSLEPGRYTATTTGADLFLQDADGDWCYLWIVDEEGSPVAEVRTLEAKGTHTLGFSIADYDGSGPFYIDDSGCGGPFTAEINAVG